MGQKINPHGLRVVIVKDWDSKWYAESNKKKMDSYNANVRTKSRKYNFYSAKVLQFTRCVMRKSTKRLILPRNRLLA